MLFMFRRSLFYFLSFPVVLEVSNYFLSFPVVLDVSNYFQRMSYFVFLDRFLFICKIDFSLTKYYCVSITFENSEK